MISLLRNLAGFVGLLRRFNRNRDGNMALTFALSALPLVGFVGVAVDYSHNNSVKAAMQAALDSTALMISRDATTLSSSALNNKAKTYFVGLFNRPETSNVQVTASYNSGSGSQVVINGSVDVATTFMAALGVQKTTITGSSTAKWGSSRLRVALVLDNTGSMADDGKMTALKTTTTNLLSQLKSAATTDGDVYVSIIPFAKDVNLGTANYNASWIDWTAWNSANTACSGYLFGNYCFGTMTTASHATWNGCVTDRGGSSAPASANYDQNVLAPNSSIAASLYPAEQYSACPVAAMGLNYNWTAMNAQVALMTPNGATNQPIGLVHGWLSLAGGGPFAVPAMDPNYTYNQIIILLSDGLNTQDRWYGNGSATSTQVDARMVDSSGNGTCANAKTAGIQIYTIQVNTGGDPTSTLLQNCASASNMFFQLTSASQIVTTFSQIGTNLTKLRVAN